MSMRQFRSRLGGLPLSVVRREKSLWRPGTLTGDLASALQRTGSISLPVTALISSTTRVHIHISKDRALRRTFSSPLGPYFPQCPYRPPRQVAPQLPDAAAFGNHFPQSFMDTPYIPCPLPIVIPAYPAGPGYPTLRKRLRQALLYIVT